MTTKTVPAAAYGIQVADGVRMRKTFEKQGNAANAAMRMLDGKGGITVVGVSDHGCWGRLSGRGTMECGCDKK